MDLLRGLTAASALVLAFVTASSVSFALDPSIREALDPMSREAMYNDPRDPAGGNPKGDVTIVAFLDYNCPYCKKSAADLARIVKNDGKIRLVYKDWPILGRASEVAARLALAAAYQGRYEAAHSTLMKTAHRSSTKEELVKALGDAGIDTKRLDADLVAHGGEIDEQLASHEQQGAMVGFQGTPAYLIGETLNSTLDYKGFKRAVADARAHKAGE